MYSGICASLCSLFFLYACFSSGDLNYCHEKQISIRDGRERGEGTGNLIICLPKSNINVLVKKG